MNQRLTQLIFLLALFCWPSASVAQTDEKQESQANEQEECELPEVATELATRVEQDQKARFAMIEAMKQKPENKTDGNSPSVKELNEAVRVIDRNNTAWLGKLVEDHGWPGKTLVGEKGAHNAWLLVQHADANLEFQKKCLKLMEAMPKGEVSLVEIAYLTDRVLSAQGLPQRYGTQCSMNDGKASVNEVEDPDNLNKRRKEVGLGSIEEYLKTVEKMYGSSKS